MDSNYDFNSNADLLQGLTVAVLIDNNREMMAQRLGVSVSIINEHIVPAAALSAAKSGNIRRTADRFGVDSKVIAIAIRDHPYLSDISNPPTKTKRQLQLELQALTQRFDRLVNDLNFAAIVEAQQLQVENQRLLAEKAELTAKLEKLK